MMAQVSFQQQQQQQCLDNVIIATELQLLEAHALSVQGSS
jgi:hypothetical protein